MGVRGVRGRLIVTLVALVGLTAAVLGVGSYLFVDASLHQRLLDDATAQARFDLAVLVPERLPDGWTRDDAVILVEALRLRGDVGTILDLGDGDPIVSSLALAGAIAALPSDLRDRVAGGELAYAWTDVAGRPSLVVAGRVPPDGPDLYFVRDAVALESALTLLRSALLAGTLALVVLAALVAGVVAHGVLAPVDAASRAAERIEGGDLSARVPVSSSDEFGRWADRFNRMAATLEDTIDRLRAAEAQNRRFVADVSHELRTPLGALVAEASILREHLDGLPPDARRTGELLVDDVARLRGLVEELMELSRFDAGAETVDLGPVDLTRLVRGVAAARTPAARLDLPPGPVVVQSDPRRLERILANLLDNTVEHAPGAAVEVVLRDERSDGAIELVVADHGPGVADGDLERIFGRFAKADPSRRGGSSGLGLAIAREHATLLGGTLRAHAVEGGGLAVVLRLPVTGSLPGSDDPATSERDPDGGQPAEERLP
jgi:signal transduction histidine kinase